MLRLLATPGSPVGWTIRSPSGSPATPGSQPTFASQPTSFASSAAEYNRLTGASISDKVLWTEAEARVEFAKEAGVEALKHSTPLPFGFCIRNEAGRRVGAERVKAIRALIREVCAELEALPDKRVPNAAGALRTRCRSYYQDHHRFALLQAVRTIESSAPEMALCAHHYKTLNGIDRRLKSISSKDTRTTGIKTEDTVSGLAMAGTSLARQPQAEATGAPVRRKKNVVQALNKRVLDSTAGSRGKDRSKDRQDLVPSSSMAVASARTLVQPLLPSSASNADGSSSQGMLNPSHRPFPACNASNSCPPYTHANASASSVLPSYARADASGPTSGALSGRQLPSFTSMFGTSGGQPSSYHHTLQAP
ncbi:hypothetical protein OC842_007876, partial [Tilletia horrida]